jgi:hypothetical protein
MLYHVTIPVKGRFQAFLDEAGQRRAARTVARIAGERLLAWAIPGNHCHFILAGTRAEVGCLVRDLRLAFRGLGVVLVDPHYREIGDSTDLEYVVGYQLKQARRHQSCVRPALFSCGCFVDLVGARVLDGWDAGRLFAYLPHYDPQRHLHHVAAAGLPRPVGDAELRAAGAIKIAEAAAAALATPWPIAGNTPVEVAARRVAAALAESVGISRRDVAFALGVTLQAVGRLVRTARNPRHESAVRVRLGLEALAMVAPKEPKSGGS